MSVACEGVERSTRPGRPRLVRRDLPWRKRLAYMALIYVTVFVACVLLSEVGFRLFWNPKYWIHTDRFLVGSGQTDAGRKWWPDTKYSVESCEFRTEFRTNAQGYRARPGPPGPPSSYRIAFVGDSFTEGMQVAYESTFCARLEGLLTPPDSSPALVCENVGVSATDLLEYWHRIHHDVLAGDPPDALVLCIYPGNDFQGTLPDGAFDALDQPLPDFYRKPNWVQHVIAWINLHSKFGCYSQRALLSVAPSNTPAASRGPKNWWADPAVTARAAAVPAVRRCRSLLLAIERECRERGTKLCVLVVGPVANYTAANGASPLVRIFAGWGLEVPVFDIAIKARALPGHQSLTFPLDGHLTADGHAYFAREAAPLLQAVLSERRPSGSLTSK